MSNLRMIMTIGAGGVWAAAGCKEQVHAAPCATYHTHLRSCLEEAGVSVTEDTLAESACAQVQGAAEAALFECITPLLADADCSTTEGIRAVSAAAAECKLALPGRPPELSWP